MKPPKVLFISVLLGVVSAAFAHDTWLMPNRFDVSPNDTVTLDLTSGMEFPRLDAGPNAERAKCRLAGRNIDVPDKAAGPNSLQFKAQLAEEGIATLWVMLPSREIELKPEEVKEYLDEVAASETLRKQWSEMQPQRWRESYVKHPKSFVRVGNPKSDTSWREPVGMFLEIVPEKDPTAIHPSDQFTVRVLKDGKPLAHFALNVVAGGETKGETRSTDADGRVTFRCPKAGPWLLRGTDIRKSSKPGTDWESDFATLTLNVRSN